MYMYNEKLEQLIEEKKISLYIHRGYLCAKENNLEYITINNMGFFHHENEIEEMKLFKQNLIEADIKYFVISDSSSGLMDDIHTLYNLGCSIEKNYTHEYTDKWGDKDTIKGLLFKAE